MIRGKTIGSILNKLVLVIAVTAAATASSGCVVAKSPGDRIDDVFAEFDRPDHPGAAALVTQDGDVVYRKVFGQANLEHGIPITPSTVFDVASVSKQFTGMAIAMMVESGQIALDDDIREYLPELPDFGHTITIGHLVHHTSGLRDWPGMLALAGWQMGDVISFEQILRTVSNQRELNFTPGSENRYSNTGYNVLAALVERVSGQSFREWTTENIFDPLDMSDTHFQDNPNQIIVNRAQGYGNFGDGFRNIPNNLTALGSSSLYTTLDDVAKWVMNFDDGRVGGAKVIERMRQRGTLNDGEKISYAFGQSAGQHKGIDFWIHTGVWAGFGSIVVRFPEQRLAVVVLSNRRGIASRATALAIADHYLGDVQDTDDLEGANAGSSASPGIVLSAEDLDEYVGDYRLGAGWVVSISRDGNTLMTQATREDRFPMRAVSEQEFFIEAYGASMTFQRNDEGEVDRLLYRDIEAPRVASLGQLAEDLTDYEGVFYSAELDTAYTLSVEDGVLLAQHRRHRNIELSRLLPDEFLSDSWFFSVVEFDRDPYGDVLGFRVSQLRSRNIRFTKIDEVERPGGGAPGHE